MTDFFVKNKKICIVFGKTGVGKSSFINYITNTSDRLAVSDEGQACTEDFDLRECKSNPNIVLIDTPGLLDMKGDNNNESKIQHALSEYKISYIIILLKFQDVRVDKPLIDMLQSYMEFLPMKDFWKHVIIVYTNAKKKDEDFEEDKSKVEGKIIQILNKDDFRPFKEFMKKNGIDLPNKLKEFYCDNRNKPERDQTYNRDEYKSILSLIENSQPMIAKIDYRDCENITDNKNGFKYWTKTRNTIYTTCSGQKINKSFILQKEELSKFEVVKTKEWKESQYVDKKCGRRSKRTFYHYFRQKLYKIGENNNQWGEKCKYSEGWENEPA